MEQSNDLKIFQKGGIVIKFDQLAEKFYRLLPKKHSKIYIQIGILLTLPIIYFFVYYTGGIKFVYSHSMYISILVAGILFGPLFGVIVAFLAGILLGPLMPIDTITMEMQIWTNWLYRLFIFMIVGWITGFASNTLKYRAKVIDDLSSMNQDTNIPNINYLNRIETILTEGKKTLITLLINNSDNISDVMGTDIYHKLLYMIFTDIKEKLGTQSVVIQVDQRKLWIVKDYNDLDEEAKRILNILNQKRSINQIPLFVDFSVGLAYVDQLSKCKQLATFKNADLAARSAQLNNLAYDIYSDDRTRSTEEYELLSVFGKAIEENELYLDFQPKIDLKTMKPCGLEALVRWMHPTKGMIPPDKFIKIVEETKLIHPLTDWVLSKALEKMNEFLKHNIEIEMSINISTKNILDPDFYKRSMDIIEASKISTQNIEFEIIETAIMLNPIESKKALEKFQKQGIKISIDDFGSGYSSLAYLSQFPVDIIKIDRFFMAQIDTTSALKHIVNSTIKLAHDLGYRVLAEGVETQSAADLITSFECDMAQGYYFSKPIRGDQIIKWYQKHL